MLPKYHIILGFLFSLALFLIFPNLSLIDCFIIFLSSFLIDIDHYIYYAFKKKDFNPKTSVKYFLNKRRNLFKMKIKERKKFYSCFCFLHGIEILVILFALGIFLSKYFIFVFLGFSFHLLLDLMQEKYLGSRMDKLSIIYDYIKFRKLKFFE
jgi:hypothetical protein